MSFLAGFPSWLVWIFGFMFLSSAMRHMFGGGRVRPPRKWEQFGRQEAERFEAALTQRDVVIEDLQQRLSEMESRLDFTERLIASRSADPARESTPIVG